MKKTLHLLLMLLFVNAIMAQGSLPNDCRNAIIVCGNGVFTYNPVNGAGDFPNEVNPANACLGKEHNSLWLQIHIAQSGTLGFDIKPLNPDLVVDYDFWVFGPNTSCTNMGAPIRCCTTHPIDLIPIPANNHTGMNGVSLSNTGGPGGFGNGYVSWLNVVAGEFYYIAIDRPDGEGGFDLNWTGTALLTTPPVANAIPDYKTCSSSYLNGVLTAIFDLESVKDEINPDAFINVTSFFETAKDAVDNINPINDLEFYTNKTNPQTIYARVTDVFSGCFNITDFDLVVSSCLGIATPSLNTFNATAYPNPFGNAFVIDVATVSQELLQIKVYDMLGKLIEQREVSPNKISSQKIGEKYPSGIYNIIVKQDDEEKTLRVIKK